MPRIIGPDDAEATDPSDEDVKWIKCGKHGVKRRWSIVCIHLLDGASTDWNEIDGGNDDGVNDWLCNKCLDRFDKLMDANHPDYLKDIRPVCVVCVDQIRFLLDRNYQPKKGGGL